MRSALALLSLPLLAAPPTFTARQAIRAEWNRQPPTFSETDKAQLPAADRARLEQTLARIGAPGAPPLLPQELDKPTLEIWEAKALAAKTPQQRFTALYFLNRLKSAKALLALNGLEAKDAETWPKHLHLEASLATARLNGAEISPELQGFLDGLQKVGKIDPVRAQAARLRLVMGGKEKELLTPLVTTGQGLFSLFDVAAKLPVDQARSLFNGKGESQPHSLLDCFNLPNQVQELRAEETIALIGKDLETKARIGQLKVPELQAAFQTGKEAHDLGLKRIVLEQLIATPGDVARHFAEVLVTQEKHPRVMDALLPALRKLNSSQADILRLRLLSGPDPIARAAAIDDMTEAPADLEALITRLWKTEEYDGVQILLQSLEKWKLPEDRRKALLKRFYEHPCWTARLDAFTQLRKLDPAAPWPAAPAPTAEDRAQLALAERLATQGRPVRMRLHFAGRRQVTLRLDPVNAPLNVANLMRLARKGFFNGRLVPRVVPDFVVQMGSPCDTMDGGPGYTVRCENSLDWYGPGSVGMALSGKDTGGSQFFITTNATPHLTGKYTRVGEVENLEQAMKVLDDLELGAKLRRVEVLAR